MAHGERRLKATAAPRGNSCCYVGAEGQRGGGGGRERRERREEEEKEKKKKQKKPPTRRRSDAKHTALHLFGFSLVTQLKSVYTYKTTEYTTSPSSSSSSSSESKPTSYSSLFYHSTGVVCQSVRLHAIELLS